MSATERLGTLPLPALPPSPRRGTAHLIRSAHAITDRLDAMAHLWSWNLRRIDAPQAWDITHGDPSVIIAVVDTGIDAAHPDLRGKILPGVEVATSPAQAAAAPQGTSNPQAASNPHDTTAPPGALDLGQLASVQADGGFHDAVWLDDQGHGTAVAGVIASRGWRGRGLAGVAPACRLLPIKCNVPGTGAVHAEHIAAGVRAAVARGARILNLSVGVVLGEELLTGETLAAMRTAILEALGQGCVVVCAAGPAGPYEPYPSSWTLDPRFAGLIAVGAATRQNTLSPSGASGPFVTVYAPADGILSTARGGDYGPFGATSAAAPHVSGIAALIRSIRPEATPAQVRDCIVEGARGGLANALGALRAAQQL